MGYARTWTIRSTIIGNNIAHGNLLIAVKKPQAQLQFHRSQRRRRTCDWRSCVMSRRSCSMSMNWKIFWRHVFPRNRSAFCSCLDSHLSAQELENGRLAMFAFSGIVTQVAPWSEMWVVFSKAKATLHKVFLSRSLSLSLSSNMDEYPQVSLFTKPFRTYSFLSYLVLRTCSLWHIMRRHV